MKIFDISLPITNGMMVWPDDPPVDVQRAEKIEDGDDVNLTVFNMSAHTGTHVDAPFHFLADGKKVHELSLDILNGSVQVVQVPSNVTVITSDILNTLRIEPVVERVLFKTLNSETWARGDKEFSRNYVGLSADAADELVQRKIKLVGIDALSIASFDQIREPHEILLGNEVIIVEGLNLAHVSPGKYTLHCLPLNLVGADGSPARTILIQEFD